MDTRKLSRVLAYTVLVVAIGSVSYINYKQKQDESEEVTVAKANIQEQQKAENQVINTANESTDQTLNIKNRVKEFISKTEQIDYADLKLNMGYEYMTVDLAKDFKNKYEAKNKKMLEAVKANKVQVKVTDIKFDEFKYTNEEKNEASVNITIIEDYYQDDKKVSTDKPKYQLLIGESPTGAWLISYIKGLN